MTPSMKTLWLSKLFKVRTRDMQEMDRKVHDLQKQSALQTFKHEQAVEKLKEKDVMLSIYRAAGGKNAR